MEALSNFKLTLAPSSYNTLFIVLLFLIGLTRFTDNLSAQLKPIELGSASNIYSILVEYTNQVYANQDIDLVTFIHRQDITIWGGSANDNGILRYDISTDGGATFNTDIGPLNPVNKYPGRYPQITGLDPRGISNPLNEQLIYAGTTLENGDWNAMVSGVSETTILNPLTTTEHSVFNSKPNLIFGGLCQGKPGEFWTVTQSYDGVFNGDSLFVAKGIYNTLTQDIGWSIHQTIHPNHYLGLNGSPVVISPNMAFSPDGGTGWIAYLGDLVGGTDSVLNPVLIPSFNSGSTWETPIEVDLSALEFLSDSKSLSQELQDEITLASTEGRATCSFEFDLTVDRHGNPHLFVVIQSATTPDDLTPNYSVRPDHVKLAVDIYTEDRGNSWKAFTVSPIYAFRKNDIGLINPVTMDNFPQIARNKAGDHIFYSWVDSDTTGYAGSNENMDPNLRISSLRLDDHFISCPKWVTKGDKDWDGIMYFPTMAPEVLEISKGYRLPIVSVELLSTDAEAPVQFWYFGNEAVINESDYMTHHALLNTDSCVVNCVNDILAAGFQKDINGYDVIFTDTSQSFLEILTWNWQFGDGAVSGDQHPEHTYTSPGTFNVQLIVTTDCGVDVTIVPVSVPDSDGDGVPDHLDICAYGDDNKDVNMNMIPDDCECQTIDLITASMITQDTVYIVRDEIISADMLQNDIYVLYKAGESITLNSGFEVNLGVTFVAAPVSCQEVMGILPKVQLPALKALEGKTIIELKKKRPD